MLSLSYTHTLWYILSFVRKCWRFILSFSHSLTHTLFLTLTCSHSLSYTLFLIHTLSGTYSLLSGNAGGSGPIGNGPQLAGGSGGGGGAGGPGGDYSDVYVAGNGGVGITPQVGGLT